VEGADGELEGMLGRKHAWETTTKKAAHRSWDRVFTVLMGNQLNFYKDSKSYRSAPDATYRSETGVDLLNSEAEVAADYTKKKNVFRLKLANGGDYLFQCTDDEEMNMWISAINIRAGGDSGPSKSQTLPSGAGGQKDEPKRRSFFTLKKK
jgi:spectrin beta